ncbi:MAG TPA: DUF2493 domain-containing protein [Candidatus Poseidoniales archaeon]|nr:MAG: hypothetical protein CXX81_15470 [Euryarchaeota archaeon]PXY78196.1 MAG: hypothetical protein CXX81_08945 [Euryarchaeota archaeon]PXY78728.1 MAG: hypothetical protein CXX81_06350 [Euryarchaeota archaeon]HHZ73667.1 DUF2493 domain-containing protein [Candidatus Poseidoniales archaeon]
MFRIPFFHAWVYLLIPLFGKMMGESGRDVLGRLGGKDLNEDGRIINLVIVGSSRFYDFSIVEEAIEEWTLKEAHPDLVITGGASGVDYLAERWAENNNVPHVVFNEEWGIPREGLEDTGRREAPTSLTHQLLDAATHLIAFPSPTSKWTRVVIEMVEERGIPFTVVEVD